LQLLLAERHSAPEGCRTSPHPRPTAGGSSNATACRQIALHGHQPARSPISLPVRRRRECARTPNAHFCSLGTMRKLVMPKTSLRSAALMAALRTADLSRAGGRALASVDHQDLRALLSREGASHRRRRCPPRSPR
jgi:hypothetical protein